ncbi:MAG: ATP-binding cassette domain-containing protein [Opitutales bacterium]
MNLNPPETATDTSAPTGSKEVVLRARGLHKAFGGQVVLDQVDLDLNRGEVVLLRGENGSGKTTLLNILTGNLEPDAGVIEYRRRTSPVSNQQSAISNRTYRFPRRWWQDLNPWDHFRPEFVAREGIGRTWQDIRLFKSMSLRDNIAVATPDHPGENPLSALFAPYRSADKETSIREKAEKRLEAFGLGTRDNSSGDRVSLGQSKRVAIARALAAGAHVLFLDEPLAGLDRQGIREVLAALEKLVRDEELTLVIVEHVFNFVHLHHLVTREWMLKDGRIESSRMHPIPQEDHVDGISVNIAAPAWMTQLTCGDTEIKNEALPRGASLTRIRRAKHWQADANPLLEVNNILVERGRQMVIGLDAHGESIGFNLSVQPGEIVILQAPNGWGKSTLFETLCGNVNATAGSIQLNGTDIQTLPPWFRVEAGLSACPSAAYLFPSLRVSEAARLSREVKEPDTASMPFAERTISSLSGGEKQRTLLRLTIPVDEGPRLLLLDEPFAMLDDRSSQELIKTLITLQTCHAQLIFSPASK